MRRLRFPFLLLLAFTLAVMRPAYAALQVPSLFYSNNGGPTAALAAGVAATVLPGTSLLLTLQNPATVVSCTWTASAPGTTLDGQKVTKFSAPFQATFQLPHHPALVTITTSITDGSTTTTTSNVFAFANVATSVTSADYVRVDAYGADPTGVVDSTPAFTSCIAAAAPLGRSCFAPCGTYAITSLQVFDQPVSLIGCSGWGNQLGATGTILVSTSNAPIIQYSGRKTTCTTTNGSNQVTLTSTTGFAVGNALSVSGFVTIGQGTTFNRGAGHTADPYALISSFVGAVATVDGTANASNASPTYCQRIDQPSEYVTVRDVNFRGSTSTKTTTTANMAPLSTSVNVASIAGMVPYSYFTMAGAGQPTTLSTTPPFANPSNQFLLLTASGSTITFTPPTRSDIAVNSPVDVRAQMVVIDNMSMRLENVEVDKMGGHGILLAASIGTRLHNVGSNYNALDGINIDDTISGTVGGATTFTSGSHVLAGANGGNGVNLVHGPGHDFDGLDVEHNTLSGVLLQGAGMRAVRDCRITMWSELNGVVETFLGGTRNNHLLYAHNNTGGPNDNGIGNDWDGQQDYGSGVGQTRISQLAGNRQVQGISGAAQSIDFSVSHMVESTISANVTGTPGLSFTNFLDGDLLTWCVIQGGVGSFTISNYSSNIKWAGGTAPTLSTNAGYRDCFVFLGSGSTAYQYAPSAIGIH